MFLSVWLKKMLVHLLIKYYLRMAKTCFLSQKRRRRRRRSGPERKARSGGLGGDVTVEGMVHANS